MTLDVEFSDDPAHVLAEARFFLAADPVRNNLILTLLSDRVAHPEPGRYRMVRDNGLVVGVAFQSPCIFPVTVSPMPVNVVRILVDAIRIAGAELPGVSAEAATAAALARAVDRGKQVRCNSYSRAANFRGAGPLHRRR